ncbi:hypothetical protein TeGR_g2654, partial [Tetraparma gracilis]
MFDTSNAIQYKQNFLSLSLSQTSPTAVKKARTLKIHAEPLQVANDILRHLDAAVLRGKVPTTEPASPPPTASHEFHQNLRRIKKTLHHHLLLRLQADQYSSNGSLRVDFRSASEVPHAIAGSFTLVRELHGCSLLTVAVKADAVDKKRRSTRRASTTRGASTRGRASTRRGSAVKPKAPTAEGAPAEGDVLSYEHANELLDSFLNLVPVLFAHYDKSSEVDMAELERLSDFFETTTTEPTRNEAAVLNEALAFDEKPWRRIAGTVREPVEYFQAKATEGSAWGKAFTTVDASAISVVSWLWHFMSYERVDAHKRDMGDRMRMAVDVPNSHSMFQAAKVKIGPGIDDRIFGAYWTWRKEEDGSFSLVVAPVKAFQEPGHPNLAARFEAFLDDHARATRSVRGSIIGSYRVVPLAENVCRVTLVFQGDVKGKIPVLARDWSVKSMLTILDIVRDRFEREGKAVDAELRAALPPPPSLSELGDDARRVVRSCLALEKKTKAAVSNSGAKKLLAQHAIGASSAAVTQVQAGNATESLDDSWVKLTSKSPFVSFSMKYTKPEGKRTSRVVGKAKAVIDCSAREALAYQFAACGREKMRILNENSQPATLILLEHTEHDFEWATVKTLPFPLTNREFLGRQLCYKDDVTGDFVLVCEPLPENVKVDYGANLKVVRGNSSSILRITSIKNDTQCEVNLVQCGDAGGFVPERVIVAKIPVALSGVVELRELFQRDAAVDEVECDAAMDVLEHDEQVYDDEEDVFLVDVRTKLGGLKEEDSVELLSPDSRVKMYSVQRRGGGGAIERAA